MEVGDGLTSRIRSCIIQILTGGYLTNDRIKRLEISRISDEKWVFAISNIDIIRKSETRNCISKDKNPPKWIVKTDKCLGIYKKCVFPISNIDKIRKNGTQNCISKDKNPPNG
jgi:hypothetical protein